VKKREREETMDDEEGDEEGKEEVKEGKGKGKEDNVKKIKTEDSKSKKTFNPSWKKKERIPKGA